MGKALKYRPHIDGIRAIAVLAVVLYHAQIPGFPGGYVGVDVFFVISGYLITGLLLRELDETGDVSVRCFVERRIRRLAPALFVVLLATLIAGAVFLSPIGGEQQGLAKSAIATVLLAASIYFIRRDEQYCGITRAVAQRRSEVATSVIDSLALTFPQIVIIDSINTMCTKVRCPVIAGKQILYSDAHHLSVAGAKRLIPAFLAAQSRLNGGG